MHITHQRYRLEARAKIRTQQKAALNRFVIEIVVPVLSSIIDPDRYDIRLSPVDLRAKYGQNCLDIFRLLFTLHQVGGRSAAMKKSYVSMWVANKDQLWMFNAAVKAFGDDYYGPKELLAAMKALGAQQSIRVKLEGGFVINTDEDIAIYRALVKDLRKQERDETEHASATYF